MVQAGSTATAAATWPPYLKIREEGVYESRGYSLYLIYEMVSQPNFVEPLAR